MNKKISWKAVSVGDKLAVTITEQTRRGEEFSRDLPSGAAPYHHIFVAKDGLRLESLDYPENLIAVDDSVALRGIDTSHDNDSIQLTPAEYARFAAAVSQYNAEGKDIKSDPVERFDEAYQAGVYAILSAARTTCRDEEPTLKSAELLETIGRNAGVYAAPVEEMLAAVGRGVDFNRFFLFGCQREAIQALYAWLTGNDPKAVEIRKNLQRLV